MGLPKRIVEVKAVDDATLKLVLSEPYYAALEELSYTRPFTFLAPSAFKDGGTKDGIKEPIGTGPYVLKEYVANQYSTYEVNPNYWGEKPKIEKITRKVIKDGMAISLALQKGEINFVYTYDGSSQIDQATIREFEKLGKYQVQRTNKIATQFFMPNTSSNSAIKDESVRKALWMAYGELPIKLSMNQREEYLRGVPLIGTERPLWDKAEFWRIIMGDIVSDDSFNDSWKGR